MSSTVPPAAGPPSAPVTSPEGWVPVERRWLGFDRSTITYAAIVAGLLVLMHFVLPAINRAISYDDPVVTGDVLALTNGVTFEPAVGWNIVSGVREGGTETTGSVGKTAKVVSGDVSFEVTVDAFTGDSTALMAQIRKTTDALNGDGEFHVVGDSATFTTSTGLAGQMSRYASSGANGIIAGIVQNGVGIEVVDTSGSDLDQATIKEIATMLDSLTMTTPEEAAA